MGTQTWKIVGMDQQKVEVIPFKGTANALSFWKAEQRNRDFHFSEQLATFLEEWNTRIESPEFEQALCTDYYMSPSAAGELISFLKRQKEATGSDLPHRHHLLIEHFTDNTYAEEVKRIFINTIWGGKVNLPFALALSAAWEDEYHYPLEVFVDNMCVMLLLPHDLSMRDILCLVKPYTIEQMLRKRLEATGFFGALFLENAGRALLLTRQGFGKRLPL
jgi:ATP-dependent Lhr-like helicase